MVSKRHGRRFDLGDVLKVSPAYSLAYMMTNAFSRCTVLVSALVALGACSGAHDPPADAPGLAGSGAGGSAGSSAGTPASGGGGTAPGSAGSTVSGGSGGQAQVGGAGGSQASVGGTSAGGGGAGGSGTGGAGGNGGGGGSVGAVFALTSPAFDHVEACTKDATAACELFPALNVMMTIGGQNQAPELNWTAGPAGTMSYAVCLHDVTFNNPHWCIWDVPAASLQLPGNLARTATLTTPAGAKQKSFSGNDSGYMGPGAKGNVYQFRLYALKTATFTPPQVTQQSVYNTLEQSNDVLAKSTLRGRASPN